jgi:hypothetical protein
VRLFIYLFNSSLSGSIPSSFQNRHLPHIGYQRFVYLVRFLFFFSHPLGTRFIIIALHRCAAGYDTVNADLRQMLLNDWAAGNVL